MADTLTEMWEDAKSTFEKTTGKKKPKDSKGLLNAFGAHTGLSGSLTKFDRAEIAANRTNNARPDDCTAGLKLAVEMDAQLASFRRASASYTQVLDKAITGDIDNRTEKDTKTAYERALKFLQKQLTAIEETGAGRVGSIRQRFDAAQKDLGVKQKMLLNWKKNISGAVARGEAAVARVKADPTVTSYNSIFPKAARDITMQLVFAKDLDGFSMDPAELLKTMNPWASQAGKAPAVLPPTATDVHVKSFLSAFSKELKKVSHMVHTQAE